MSEYTPPLEDMKFTLKEVVDVKSLEDFPSFENVGLESLEDLLDEAGRFFSQVISPTNRTGDLQGSSLNPDGSVTTPDGFLEAYSQYVDAGWGAISFDPEYGGGGFGRVFFYLPPLVIHQIGTRGGVKCKKYL